MEANESGAMIVDQAVDDSLLSQLITRPAALGLALVRFSPTFLLGNISGGAGPGK